MEKILTLDEIDTLLENVAGDAVAPQKKAGEASPYDFNYPNLISRHRMRVLNEIHEGFCRNIGVYLSSQLGMIVEVELISIDPVRFSEFMASIATPSSIYECEIVDKDTSLLLDFAPQLCVFLVERLLGGRGEFLESARAISPIEQKVMQRLVKAISGEISEAWKVVNDYAFQVKRFESNPEFVQIFPVDDPVVIVTIAVKIHGNPSLFNICYPFSWISPIISKDDISQRVLHGKKDLSLEESNTLQKTLLTASIEMRAELGSSRLTIGEFIQLRPNDIIRLHSHVSEPLKVYVNRRHCYNASIGTSRQKYAFRINDLVAPGTPDSER